MLFVDLLDIEEYYDSLPGTVSKAQVNIRVYQVSAQPRREVEVLVLQTQDIEQQFGTFEPAMVREPTFYIQRGQATLLHKTITL